MIDYYNLRLLVRDKNNDLHCPRCGVRAIVFSNGAGSSFWNHIKDGKVTAYCPDEKE